MARAGGVDTQLQGPIAGTLTAAGALTVHFAITSLLVLAKGMWQSGMELEEWLGLCRFTGLARDEPSGTS